MKFLILLTALLSVLTGCVNVQDAFYAAPSNWVICGGDKAAEYDVFYVYPTLAGKAKTSEMEWKNNPKLQKKITGFAHAQTYGIFGKNIRVFSPYVHQLTYATVKEIMKKRPLTKAEWKQFERGMKETLGAFRYYLRYYNKGRPYILLGHSQGAMDLYYLMEHCPEIRKEKGFAAAYLAGLPHISAAQMEKDFGNRIEPARNADDLGVVAAWNTQNKDADASLMAGNGAYCINPLNWHTDGTPAGRELHIRAYFYDYRMDRAMEKSQMFGARVDPARGVLIVDLPSRSAWDANAFIGAGIFHMNDVWFFAGNIRANAENRIRNWKKEFRHE